MDGQIKGIGREGDLLELGAENQIFPSYDFHPIPRPELKPESNSQISQLGIRDYGSIERLDSSKPPLEINRVPNEMFPMAVIDSTMKKYADMLLHAVEGVSSRLSQLESRTRNLEHAFDELKASIGSGSDNTDVQLKHLDTILKEVKSGMQVIRDKQEISQAQSQASKLLSPAEISIPAQPQPPQLPPQPLPTAQPPPPPPNAPPHTQIVHQNPPIQFSDAQPPQISYFPSPVPAPADPPRQQYALPPQQYPLPPHQTNIPPEMPPPVPAHPYPPPTQQPHFPPELPPPMPAQHYPQAQQTHIPPELPPPMPSQHYQPLPPQHYPPGPHQAEEPAFPSAYAQTRPVNLPPQQLTRYGPGSVRPSGPPSTGYQRLPSAQLLPQALPVAGGPSSDGSPTGKRVPVDDVVEKVAAMGFPRDVVRETVRRMTENGQSVDLNVVLDRLMNGEESQSRRGWFGQ